MPNQSELLTIYLKNVTTGEAVIWLVASIKAGKIDYRPDGNR